MHTAQPGPHVSVEERTGANYTRIAGRAARKYCGRATIVCADDCRYPNADYAPSAVRLDCPDEMVTPQTSRPARGIRMERYGVPGDPFYSSPLWRAFRRAFLCRHPLCVVAGCTTPATHVDHTRSRRAGGAPFDPANCRALCPAHHNAKTARLDQPGRCANHHPLRAPGCDAAGWPRAPDHPWRGGQRTRRPDPP
jgi:5-methylcytosine-specific restriction endonuclease McrA